MPHQVGQCIMVIAATVVGMFLHNGLVHQTDLVGMCEYMTDASWANWDPETCVEAISCPYYCQCARWSGAEWEYLESGTKPHAILTGTTWIPRNRSRIEEAIYFEGGSIVQEERQVGWSFQEWIDRHQPEIVFQTQDPPKWPASTISQEDKMFVSMSVQITPGKLAHDEENEESRIFKDTAPNIMEDNCMKEGITLGRSTAFITAVMCEMLRAYTVKSLRPAHETFFRNNWMHLACSISFIFTVSLTIIPGVREIFKLLTPRWFFYKIAFIFAFSNMLIDEIAKYFYRRALAERKKVEAARLRQVEATEKLEMMSDMLHKMEAGRAKTDSTVYDLKESVGALVKSAKKAREANGGVVTC